MSSCSLSMPYVRWSVALPRYLWGSGRQLGLQFAAMHAQIQLHATLLHAKDYCRRRLLAKSLAYMTWTWNNSRWEFDDVDFRDSNRYCNRQSLFNAVDSRHNRTMNIDIVVIDSLRSQSRQSITWNINQFHWVFWTKITLASEVMAFIDYTV